MELGLELLKWDLCTPNYPQKDIYIYIYVVLSRETVPIINKSKSWGRSAYWGHSRFRNTHIMVSLALRYF